MATGIFVRNVPDEQRDDDAIIALTPFAPHLQMETQSIRPLQASLPIVRTIRAAFVEKNHTRQ